MLRHFTFNNNGYNTSNLASSILHHHLSESPSWFYPKYNIHNPSNATKRRFEISRIFSSAIYYSIPRLFSRRSPAVRLLQRTEVPLPWTCFTKAFIRFGCWPASRPNLYLPQGSPGIISKLYNHLFRICHFQSLAAYDAIDWSFSPCASRNFGNRSAHLSRSKDCISSARLLSRNALYRFFSTFCPSTIRQLFFKGIFW